MPLFVDAAFLSICLSRLTINFPLFLSHIPFQDQPCTFCDKYIQNLVKLLQMIWGYATRFLLGLFLYVSVYVSDVWKIRFAS